MSDEPIARFAGKIKGLTNMALSSLRKPEVNYELKNFIENYSFYRERYKVEIKRFKI